MGNVVRLRVLTDPVVAPLARDEEREENSEEDKDEDIGITFVAQNHCETPKSRAKSGLMGFGLSFNIKSCTLIIFLFKYSI